MAEEKTKQYRMAPLTARQRDEIRGAYRKGDACRDAVALGEKYNVPASDIIAVVTYTYRKGDRKK